MSNKDSSFKEKFKQALSSTVKVISDDLNIKKEHKENSSSKKFESFELDNLNNKIDFIKVRAEADSIALKKKIF